MNGDGEHKIMVYICIDTLDSFNKIKPQSKLFKDFSLKEKSEIETFCPKTVLSTKGIHHKMQWMPFVVDNRISV